MRLSSKLLASYSIRRAYVLYLTIIDSTYTKANVIILIPFYLLVLIIFLRYSILLSPFMTAWCHRREEPIITKLFAELLPLTFNDRSATVVWRTFLGIGE